jgi:hypothetical protein
LLSLAKSAIIVKIIGWLYGFGAVGLSIREKAVKCCGRNTEWYVDPTDQYEVVGLFGYSRCGVFDL